MTEQIARRWALWRLPRRALIGYPVLALAGAFTALSLIPVRSENLFPFAVLIFCAAVYPELSRPIERLRRTGRPFIDLNSVWMFAAVLLLHPALSAAVIVASYTSQWIRNRPGKAVSAAATIVAGYAAYAFLAWVSVVPFDRMPRDMASFGVVVSAGLLFLIVDSVLIHYADPHDLEAGDYALSAAAIALGIMLAWALVDWPSVLVLIVGIALVLHRGVLIRQLRDQARIDSKTGLLNSASWSKDATAQLRRGESSALLMLDLDNFKTINDKYGHLVGDKHLKDVADVLKAEVRGTDVVGRFGGEEFVILLPGTSLDDAMAVAERIRRRIDDLGTVTVSVGVAAHPEHGSTLEEVVNAADLALLAAKTAGRNRTLLFAAPQAPGW
jgi:diguanylate cyclase (GGDEF)-like protein